jgi:hypothetical protein
VERQGVRESFRVVDESTGGLGLEGDHDSTALELGADCLVRVNSDSSVLVRGARVIRVERTAFGLRVGLEFHFQHPLPPTLRRAPSVQASL